MPSWQLTTRLPMLRKGRFPNSPSPCRGQLGTLWRVFFIRSSLNSMINSAVRFISAGRPAWLEASYYVFPVCIRAQEFRCIRGALRHQGAEDRRRLLLQPCHCAEPDLAACRESAQKPCRYHRSDHESDSDLAADAVDRSASTFWASGDVSRLKIDQPVGFVGESATPTQMTAGIDTMTSGGIQVGLNVAF